MADKDDKKTKEKSDGTPGKDPKPSSAGGKAGIVSWMIMAVIIIGLSASGFVLGRLAADSLSPIPEEDASQQTETKADTKADAEAKDQVNVNNEDIWYYNELSSVVVNPDEPGATRFVRVGLILEIDAELTAKKAEELIPKRQPLLINWMNLYFKGLSLDQMEDEADMNRILAQITDAFNEILFPDEKPMIKRTLIREFNIQ